MEYQFYGEKIEKKNGETSKKDNHGLLSQLSRPILHKK